MYMSIKKAAHIFLIAVFLFSTNIQNAHAAGVAPTVAISMSDTNLTIGETAITTFTFSEAPVNFNLSDVTASGGALSDLVTISPFVYQATFTPTNNFLQDSNSITVAPKVTIKNYIRSDDYPITAAYDGTNMWAANYLPDGSILKLTPDGTFTKYAGDGNYHRAMAFDGTNMWTANMFNNSVTKFSPTGVSTVYTGIGALPMAIAFDGTSMWVVNHDDDSVAKIGPTGTITTYTGVGVGPISIAFDGTNMWTANISSDSVTKISPTGVMTTYTGTGSGPSSIAFDGTNMWTANGNTTSVTKISPTGVMTTYTGTDTQPISIAFDGTNMWTGNYTNHTLTRVSPTGAMTTYSGISGSPYTLTFDGANIWSANLGSTPGLSKIGTTAATTSASYAVRTVRSSRPAPVVRPQGMKNIKGEEIPLDFKINNNAKVTNSRTVQLQLNGDPQFINGYAVSLDQNFTNEGIRPYTESAQKGIFVLPEKYGAYTLYLQYFSTTGTKSVLLKKEISYTAKKPAAKTVVKSKKVLKRR